MPQFSLIDPLLCKPCQARSCGTCRTGHQNHHQEGSSFHSHHLFPAQPISSSTKQADSLTPKLVHFLVFLPPTGASEVARCRCPLNATVTQCSARQARPTHHNYPHTTPFHHEAPALAVRTEHGDTAQHDTTQCNPFFPLHHCPIACRGIYPVGAKNVPSPLAGYCTVLYFLTVFL